MALRLQHEATEVIARVNAFLGFAAIGRLRIEQKPVRDPSRPTRPVPRTLSEGEAARLAAAVGGIGDEALREALRRLGASMLGERNPRKASGGKVADS